MTLARRAGALAADLWTPKPRLSGSEWANAHGWIARSSGAAEGGPYSTDRAPYLAEILDVLCDETHPEVVVNKPAQVGLTEAMNQAIGYAMHHDPSGILVIQPTETAAKAWVKERIDPMLAESPALRGIIRSEGGRRTSDDTMARKVFRGGWMVAVGANAPAGLRSRPARRVFGDERSGWTLDARNQGDPWDLAGERCTTFWNRKQVQFSTPGERGTCPITEAIARSDRRQWHVSCPACGHREPFTWRDPDGTYRLICDRDPTGAMIPETAAYLCRACGVLIPEHEKPRMNKSGEWIAAHPGRALVGFDFNALLSPWLSWARIIEKWREAQRDHEKLKVFVTHVLAQPHYVERDTISVHTLRERAEPLPAAPATAGIVVASVDVQKDRVETLEVAAGLGAELWTLAWDQHDGDPTHPETWDRVLQHLAGAGDRWGTPLRGVAIDTGYLPDHAWRAAERITRELRVRAFPMKGVGGPGRPVLTPPGKQANRRARRPWLVGVDTAKDTLLAHGIRVPVPPGGPGALHFASSLDPAFYDQLTSESAEPVSWGGRTAVVWRKRDPRAANEALDLLVYALAAAIGLHVHFGVRLERRAGDTGTTDAAPADDAPTPPALPVDPVRADVVARVKRAARSRRRGTWL